MLSKQIHYETFFCEKLFQKKHTVYTAYNHESNEFCIDQNG